MGVGLFLVVLGAILTFAVDDNVPNINLRVVGLILMLAGAAAIAHARHGVQRERVVTRRDEPGEPDGSPHVVVETVRERDNGSGTSY